MDFFTWELLLTVSGCGAATGVLTQLLKNLPFISKVPTQILSYVVAMIVLVLAQVFSGTITWGFLALDFFNAAIISLGTNGAYEGLQRIKGNEEQIGKEDEGI